MTLSHRARRTIALASGGVVAVGAGAVTGLAVAGMQASWSDATALQAASEVAARPGDLQPVHPVVVTRVEEHHVTPDPVVVHRKVYRTRVVSGAGQVSGPSAPRTSSSRVSPSRPRTGASTPSTSRRTAVAPAPKAPAASTKRAPAATTSKAS